MGWWETYDGTVIGDKLADTVDSWMDKLIKNLVREYPTISREQVLSTIAFCSGFLPRFDEYKKQSGLDKILVVMNCKQMRSWKRRHEIPPDTSKRVAPGTTLRNVYNPFTNKVV